MGKIDEEKAPASLEDAAQKQNELDVPVETGNEACVAPAPVGKFVNNKMFFGHGVADCKNQRFTVAILPNDEHTVQVGVSVCSDKDPFTKKIGRAIAEGRAHKKPLLYYSRPDFDTTCVEGMLNIKKIVKTDVAQSIRSVKEKLYELNKNVGE